MYKKLNKIANLEQNWNGYGADKLDENLIKRAKDFIEKTDIIASDISVFPTANNSIQIEWEKTDQSYCEAEIFVDNIQIYAEFPNNKVIFDEKYTELKTASEKFMELWLINNV